MARLTRIVLHDAPAVGPWPDRQRHVLPPSFWHSGSPAFSRSKHLVTQRESLW